MAEGLQEKQSQPSIQPRETKVPEEVLTSTKYQTEKGQLDQKNQALKTLTCIPCTSADVGNRDKFIKYIEMHEQAVQIYTVINSLPQGELSDCFDPTFGTSFDNACTSDFIDNFCKKATEEIVAVKEEKVAVKEEKVAVKKETAVVEEKTAVVEEKETEKINTLTELRAKLQDKKKYNYLNQKNVETIKVNPNPLSSDFQNAARAILIEIKEHALKSNKPEDIAEYRSFVEQFHSIGAVSEVDYAVLKREMEELSKGLSIKSAENGGKSVDYKLPDGFHESQNERGVYTKYASGSESFDQVVTIHDGKGSKDIISPKSGYSVHLDNAVNLAEYNFINQEANLRAKLGKITETSVEILARNDEFITKEEKREGKSEKDVETLEKAKQFKQEKTEELAKQKQEIEIALAKLAQEKSEKMPVSGDIETREKQANDTIQFVDNMGLYALGTENVNVFLDTIRETAIGLKLDPTQGFNKDEKNLIKKEFSALM
jgi:hypothetical protein